MSTAFMICAIFGGTILLCQLFLTLTGLGGHEAGVDGHGGTDFVHDVAHDAVHDVHAETGPDGADHAPQHLSTWLFGVISFRTLVAATTFFGLGGMAAYSASLHPVNQLAIALACAISAMLLVHWLMMLLYRLGEDHTVRISHAVGREGTVYLPIPGDKAGPGKVQLPLHGRLMEYGAVTANAAELPAGATVVVVGVVGGSTLEVAPVQEPVSTPQQS
jgi:membrane protein implicated in regulation of membrane protease activity